MKLPLTTVMAVWMSAGVCTSQDQLGSRLNDIQIPSDTVAAEVLQLTLEDAIRLGRVHNLDLRADELVPQEQSQSLRVEEAFFEPEVFGSIATGRSRTPERNTFQPSIKRESVSGELGFRQRVVTGGSFELSFSPSRLRQSTTTVGFPDRQFSSTLAASVTQPLLRGGWSDYALRNVHASQAQFAGARFRFERQVQQKLLDIVRAYWELVYARQDYRVVFRALELARQQLDNTNERITRGTVAEVDRVSDEAEVARRREELIRAENTIAQQQDNLRRLLFDTRVDAGRVVAIRPISSFEGEFEIPAEPWQELARAATFGRPDLLALRADVRIAEIDLETAERDLLPQLDLVGSYSSAGVRDTLPPAFQDSASLEFPDWTLELQLAVPIGNSAARAGRDRALLAVERTRRRLYAAELDVDDEIRDALRELLTLGEAVRAARESVRLGTTVLQTARTRLNNGDGTIFEVQQRAQELLDASQRLLRNQLDHHVARATLSFARGQMKAPVDAAHPEAR